MYKRFSILRMLSLHSLSIAGICFFACLNACKKDGQPAQAPQPPVIISSISPATGPYSTVVTITGSGFNANAANDSVKFNGIGAAVQQASATQLVVTVPKAAGTGTVTVKTGGQSGTGPVFNFTYTYTVTTLAGTGISGFADGSGPVAKFYYPDGIATDAQGNVYVADASNNRIRKITPAGDVSTLAGSSAGFANGAGTAAKFNIPKGVASDAQGNIYVADQINNCIRKITPTGDVSTIAGSSASGSADGAGTVAEFYYPHGVATDAQGNIYVADGANNSIRKITPAGIVSTLAGNGSAGFADGNGSTAQFNQPLGTATDGQGNIYVTDGTNNRIRMITPAGVVSTRAGNGAQGFADGNGIAAKFYRPNGIATDKQGNIYVADIINNRIRKISPAGDVSTIAGNSAAGFTDGNGTAAKFYDPNGIAIDSKGNIYVADGGNHSIRLITVE